DEFDIARVVHTESLFEGVGQAGFLVVDRHEDGQLHGALQSGQWWTPPSVPSAQHGQVAEQCVGENLPGPAHLAQVPALQRGTGRVELPGAARAVDLTDIAEHDVDGSRGQVTGGQVECLVQYGRGVVRRHRVGGGQVGVLLLVFRGEHPVGPVVQVRRVVH